MFNEYSDYVYGLSYLLMPLSSANCQNVGTFVLLRKVHCACATAQKPPKLGALASGNNSPCPAKFVTKEKFLNNDDMLPCPLWPSFLIFCSLSKTFLVRPPPLWWVIIYVYCVCVSIVSRINYRLSKCSVLIIAADIFNFTWITNWLFYTANLYKEEGLK